MNRKLWPLLLGIVLLAGCGETVDKPGVNDEPAAAGAGSTATASGDTELGPAEMADAAGAGNDTGFDDSAAENATDDPADSVAAADIAASSGDPAGAEAGEDATIALTPENTKIEFVGVHADEAKPDPRKGGFNTFTGTAEMEGGKLASVAVDIETGSLWTEFDKLTTHLNSPDFFDTRQHPTARFESTSIVTSAGDEATVIGDLTLMGTTKEISFPATIVGGESGPTIVAEFTIDRTEFGMDKMLEGVKPEVTITVTVGEPAAE